MHSKCRPVGCAKHHFLKPPALVFTPVVATSARQQVASEAQSEPLGKDFGQTRLANGGGGRFDRVLDTPKIDDSLLGIIERVGGARITIPGLTDRAWVDEIENVGLELDSGFTLLLWHGRDCAEAAVFGKEDALEMCVPKEGEWMLEGFEGGRGFTSAGDVLIFISR